jgi:hypothetical protein
MPAGAVPVPIDAVTGKREAGGYEFFYEGWNKDNPTRENCRFGANREDLFPADRDVTLGVTFLKNIGLSKQRIEECDALFFYQLLLPIVDPAMSGIKGDTRIVACCKSHNPTRGQGVIPRFFTYLLPTN